LKSVTEDKHNAEGRKEAKKALRTLFEEKYRTMPVAKSANDKVNHLKFLFKRLRF
jgi:hypothetical protein